MNTTQYQPKTGASCSCRPGVQRDNCRHCEGTGQQINFKAIRGRHAGYQYTQEIDAFDSSFYDTEAMRIDAQNGNFELERAEEYRHEAIVQASIINGQFTQAKNQCAKFGLNYDEQRRLDK